MSNQAPDHRDVVLAVIAAHPEINVCDDTSLDKGRAAITDWTAQRLNATEGRTIWGRKSRGKPNGGHAVDPNTDGLTYRRPDGLFEIIDVIAGATCTGIWDNNGPFADGQNGYWAPPQLGPESPVVNPPNPPNPPADTVTRAELTAALAGLRAELEQQIAAAPVGVSESRIKQMLAAATIEGNTSETGTSFLRH